MNQNGERKPALHNSHLNLLLACGEKFRRKYLEGEVEPVGTPLILGTATHAVAAKNLSHRVQYGELFSVEQVQDEAHDALALAWDEAPVLLDASEQSKGVAAVKASMMDLAVQASLLHHTVYAPAYRIAAAEDIEWRWTLTTPDELEYDLAGTADVVETVDLGGARAARVRDLKVVKQKPGQHEIEQSGQFTVYAMAVRVIKNLPVASVHLDAIVKPTKTMGLRAFSLASTRADEDIEAFLARMRTAQHAIQAGVFMPANPAEPWAPCTTCGYAQNCRYYTKRPASVSLSIPNNHEEVLHAATKHHNDGQRTRLVRVQPGTDAWLDAIAG